MEADVAIGNRMTGKAMWRILPLILIAYLFAYMDRVNVSFASLQMNRDLGFSATIYGLGGGLFFLGYAMFEVPSNMMLVRFGARKWIARIMISWGLLSAGMMFVHTPWQFYTMRFLLGVAEAGFYPGVITYFSHWFPTECRGRAISRFYVAGPLASVVMGAISSGLLGLDGTAGLRGWQWLFLVQGLPAVAIAFVLLRFLPDTPRHVAWLSEAEKTWIETRLAHEAAMIGEPASSHPLAAFANPMVWLIGGLGFLIIGATITMVLSSPAVLIAATGWSAGRIGAVVSIGGLIGAGVILVTGAYSDRTGDRFGVAFIMSLVMAVAFVVIGLAPSAVAVIAAYFAFAAVCFTIPMVTSSAWAEVLHPRQLAVGCAAINTISQIGAFSMPYAWGAAKDATGSFRAGLIGLAGVAIALALVVAYVRHLVRARVSDRRFVTAG